MSASVFKRILLIVVAATFCCSAGWLLLWAQEGTPGITTIAKGQTQEQVRQRSAGCISCHGLTDTPSMHTSGTVQLACVDCHGGKAEFS